MARIWRRFRSAVQRQLHRLLLAVVENGQVDGDAETVLPVQAEAQAAMDAADPDAGPIASLARQDFYAAAREAFAVITTGDQRFYGTLILRKGAIAP